MIGWSSPFLVSIIWGIAGALIAAGIAGVISSRVRKEPSAKEVAPGCRRDL